MLNENQTEVVAAIGHSHIRDFCQLGVTLFQGVGHDGLGVIYLEEGPDPLGNIGKIAVSKTGDPFSNLVEERILEKPTTGLGWIKVGMVKNLEPEMEKDRERYLQPTILDRQNCICAVSTEDILEKLRPDILIAISQYTPGNLGELQELTASSNTTIFVGTLSEIFVFVGTDSKIPAHIFCYDRSFFVSTNKKTFKSWRGEDKGIIEPGQVAVIQSDSIRSF